MPYVYDDVVGDVSVLVVRASEGVERDNIVTQQDFDNYLLKYIDVHKEFIAKKPQHAGTTD